MPTYSFSIYHRDIFEKSKFKDYDSLLDNRIARCNARASYLASTFEDDHCDVKEGGNSTLLITRQQVAGGGKIHEIVPKSTEVTCVNSEYLASFLIGMKPIRVTFGCSKHQSGDFSSSNSGILGLGRKVFPTEKGGYSLPSQFRSNLMSMCIPTFYSGKGSVLSFHTSKWPASGQEVQVNPSWWKFKRDMSGGIFVDTGTTFTRFPYDFYILFRYLFRAQVRDIPLVNSTVGPFDTCYEGDPGGDDLFFPVVKLYFGSVSPTTMLFLDHERVMLKYRGFYCLAFVGWKNNYGILGVNQLQGVALTFDTSENTLAFDIDACD
ncbi:hypothetical protein T459_18758 [Capsicum annuum]|uniref:Xylanase inhibitor C-terminal domain-containing protein n=1 Tax=Capsicum annuum TaxID=4072 RepID=A0A2G2YZS3_CAPAN|nr:hypothetical protein T459_18758 [Capsicum annuum]